MALSIIVSMKDFAAHGVKSPMAEWLMGRGRHALPHSSGCPKSATQTPDELGDAPR